MHLEFQNDELKPGFGRFSLIMDEDQTTINDLQDAVILSLFCWAQASTTDIEVDQPVYGWWAKQIDNRVGSVGSKLYITQRAKITPTLLERIRATIVESLQWLIDDGIAKSIAVRVDQVLGNASIVAAEIKIAKADGTNEIFKFDDLWNFIYQ